MRKLLQSPSLIEVRLRANFLENEGIAVAIHNEHQAGNPGAPHWALPVSAELWVRDPAHFEQAAKLMARYDELQNAEAESNARDWYCTKCKEPNPQNFHSCWNCGTTFVQDT